MNEHLSSQILKRARYAQIWQTNEKMTGVQTNQSPAPYVV